MNIAADLELAEGYCRFGPRGAASLPEAVEMVTRAIAYCRDQKISKLLVNVARLEHSTPTHVDRFLMAEEWAREAQGTVTVAIVARPEHIDPGKFGVKAASGFGLRADVFTSEREALEWLLRERQTDGRPAGP